MANNPGSGMANCRSCGKQIVFIRTKAGKQMPCNPVVVRYKKDPAGKEKIVLDEGSVVTGRTDISTEEMDGVGYISHFATCPAAARFRSRK